MTYKFKIYKEKDMIYLVFESKEFVFYNYKEINQKIINNIFWELVPLVRLLIKKKIKDGISIGNTPKPNNTERYYYNQELFKKCEKEYIFAATYETPVVVILTDLEFKEIFEKYRNLRDTLKEVLKIIVKRIETLESLHKKEISMDFEEIFEI